jgi:hypothetical protein
MIRANQQGYVFQVNFRDERKSKQGLTLATTSAELSARLWENNTNVLSTVTKFVGDKPVSFPLEWHKL